MKTENTTKDYVKKFIARYKGEYIEVYRINWVYYHIKSNWTVEVKNREELVFIC